MKVLLAEHGEYILSDYDAACLQSIDNLLASPDWRSDWVGIIKEADMKIQTERATNKFLAKHGSQIQSKLQGIADSDKSEQG